MTIFLPTVRELQKKFVFNGRFKVLRGGEFWKDGEVIFPEPYPICTGYQYSNKYRTLYGWGFAHNGVVLGACNYNLRFGLRRMLCRIFPEYDCSEVFEMDYDTMLRTNLFDWVDNHYSRFRKCFKECFGEMEYYEEMFDAAKRLTKEPHPKRQLREDSHREIEQNGVIGRKVWARSVEWKQKQDEIAKLLKFIRMIVDLGCAASLQGAAWCEMAKKYLASSKFVNGNCECQFVNEPAPQSIADHLHEMWLSSRDIIMRVFSDDACIVVKENGKLIYAGNLDFRSNDMCKSKCFFNVFHDCFCTPSEIKDALMGQKMLPIRIKDCNVPKRAVLLAPEEEYEQSGGTDTTILNTFAWFLAFFTMSENVGRIQKYPVSGIIASVESVGHSVSCEECFIEQDLQFLKMSVVYDTSGNHRAMINLGVILRASGSCRGDLPGSGDISIRARDFQHNLMQGMLTGIDYAPIRLLQPAGTKYAKPLDLTSYSGVFYNVKPDSEVHTYCQYEFYKRYNVTQADICEFEELVARGNVGTTTHCRLVDAVLNKDYGLNCPLVQ